MGSVGKGWRNLRFDRAVSWLTGFDRTVSWLTGFDKTVDWLTIKSPARY